MFDAMLLCGVTVELFGFSPPDGIPGLLGGPNGVPGIGRVGSPCSGRCESAIPASLRFQFCIIDDAGLGPAFTRSVCELVEGCSLVDSMEPGAIGKAGEDPPAIGIAGLVDWAIGGGDAFCTLGEGLEIKAVLSAVALAAFSAASFATFCCLKILSTLYPRRFRALRSVERMVMNNSASLIFGASNSSLHNEVETSYMST